MKCLLILICVYMFCNSEDLSPSSMSILGLTKTMIKSGWDLIEDRSIINSSKSLKYKEEEILQRFEILEKNIIRVNRLVTNVSLEVMWDVVTYLDKTVGLQVKFNDLVKYINEINWVYENMFTYVNSKSGTYRPTLKNFARTFLIFHQATSVKMFIKEINNIVARKGKYIRRSSLIELLSAAEDLENSVCISRQSPNQLLYNLYNVISLTYIKAYAMSQLSYILLEVYQAGSFATESEALRREFVNNIRKFSHEIQIALNQTSSHFRRCDPAKYQNGANYLEITNFLQGYISNKMSLNKETKCKESCAYYKNTKHYNCQHDDSCRKQIQCHGNLLNCEDAPADMSICLDNFGSTRKYKFIEYNNGTVLGQKENCTHINIVRSWQRIGGFQCSYCRCLCHEHGKYSDRFFSLRSAVSDAKHNKVVTGVRFAKKNRIIHLQVQQGELLPYGFINESTLEWVAINDFKIEERFVYHRQDYFKLTLTDRAIDLDILNGKDNQILTGVRFSMFTSHLTFEIRVTAFDFETGKLRSPNISSEWIFNSNTKYSTNKRTKISLVKPDVPIKIKAPSKIISNHNDYIEFTHTDFDKDAAQTTVPFIDAQDVVPDLPVPISGAGVYFKSSEGSGGFIGLKLITYNFKRHLNYN